MSELIVEGKIASVVDRTTVVINRGSMNGVAKGDVFTLYIDLGQLNDPDSGEPLGTARLFGPSVTVTSVETRFCVARSQYRSVSDWSVFTLFPSTIREREQLPVPDDKTPEIAFQVRVGSPVIMRRPPHSPKQQLTPHSEEPKTPPVKDS